MSQLKLDDKKLENMIEAILFASGDAVEVSFLADKLATKEAKIVSTIEKLKKKYSGDSGLHIVSFKNKVQFGTNPAYAEQVAEALSQVKEKALSKAVLETLAIVAYRQPITRLEIEDIRGVNSDYAIEMLEKNKLVEVVGRKESVGKPLLFATTESFLKRFGLKSLEQLPNQEILLERLTVINQPAAPVQASLYNYEIGKEIAKNSGETRSAMDEVAITTDDVPDFLKDEKDLVRH